MDDENKDVAHGCDDSRDGKPRQQDGEGDTEGEGRARKTRGREGRRGAGAGGTLGGGTAGTGGMRPMHRRTPTTTVHKGRCHQDDVPTPAQQGWCTHDVLRMTCTTATHSAVSPSPSPLHVAWGGTFVTIN
jgi:hypothetical protein